MEIKGANSPGILVLTTGLSKPFMRLDKYPTLLKELERHMEVLLVTCLSLGIHQPLSKKLLLIVYFRNQNQQKEFTKGF